MTTWLTLSASCVRSRHHTATKNNPPNVRRPRISIFRAMMPRQKPCCCIDATPTWISATTYQSKYCHPMRSCFLLFPEFFFKFPFLSYLAQLPSTKSSSKLSSTMWHSSAANFGILFDHWRLNKMVTRIVNSTVGTFQKCFRTLESWWFLKSLSSPVASLVLLPPEAAALSKPEERFNQDLLM